MRSNSGLNTINAARDGSVVCLQCAEPFLHFAHVLAQGIDRAANVAKMFKHEIFSFSHAASLSRYRSQHP